MAPLDCSYSLSLPPPSPAMPTSPSARGGSNSLLSLDETMASVLVCLRPLCAFSSGRHYLITVMGSDQVKGSWKCACPVSETAHTRLCGEDPTPGSTASISLPAPGRLWLDALQCCAGHRVV